MSDWCSSGQPSISIKEIDLFPVIYPMLGRFKFFEGADGRQTGRPSVLVKVTAEDGTVGWGQSVPIPKWSYESLESVTATLSKHLLPVLLGHNVFDLDGAHELMNQSVAGSFSTGMPIAKAGIDLAFHDLAGRIKNESYATLMKRSSKREVTLSWTLNPKTLDEVENLIEEGWNRGYRNFNVKVAPDPNFDLELCRMVKNIVPEGFLWTDANGGYDLSTALEVAPKLADAGAAVLEQPLPPNRLTGYRELKQQGALPIIMDEGVVSPVDLVEFIRLDLLDGVAMKPARCGGLLSAQRQIEILRSTGLMFLASGLTDPDLSLAASLCLYAAYDYELPAALNGPQFIESSVLRAPFRPRFGRLTVPRGPGLGVEVDEEKIQAIIADASY
jgi:L-alanine-DL-glutamate epimerase-like enolase superfamily enzyme